ncbi:MAG: tRNA (N6-isopentenyl adenosine(37)-C2)-methylthiotransferase MiaB [Clostridiales bacterium]|jgi:tRNA-2-methylthio-N6-dimethylallyladenosine synthase|nr:tRNA (N6-isopentenyl adenosine(37)-C2)-methylthiotransferase MiaB [Clostridiales bacterium]
MSELPRGALAAVRAHNAVFFRERGRARRARVVTFGCQMNENDSEKIMGLLCEMGFEFVPASPPGSFGNPAPLGIREGEAPELVILNTCCVRENAEQRLFGVLGSLKRWKREDPGRVVAVCGCMMQEDGAVSEIRQKYPFVDFIFGTQSISELPSLLCRVYERAGQADRYGSPAHVMAVENRLDGRSIEDDLPFHRKAPPAALVSVMTGCDNFCSYCIVPYVRGREKSRLPESVYREVCGLAASGYREVTLLGQNVNSYGKDILGGAVDFAGLLTRLCEIEGIARIRFMTSHPKDLSDRLIYAMRDLDRVCGHLHLPVQSGSTRILARMNRGYSREDYLALVYKVRGAIPDIALTTDVIVGFPGETESDFSDTLALAAEAEFDMAYTFLYSPREGTPAARLEEQVDRGVMAERFSRLVELQNGVSLKKNRRLLGSRVTVLCEGLSKTNPERLTGRTPGGRVVNFTAGELPRRGEPAFGCEPAAANRCADTESAAPPVAFVGALVDVLIEDARTWSLEGRATGFAAEDRTAGLVAAAEGRAAGFAASGRMARAAAADRGGEAL